MHQLLTALDRLGYVDDCLQLAKLNEEKKTGTFKAHQTALQVRCSRNMPHAQQGVQQLGVRLCRAACKFKHLEI